MYTLKQIFANKPLHRVQLDQLENPTILYEGDELFVERTEGMDNVDKLKAVVVSDNSPFFCIEKENKAFIVNENGQTVERIWE